MAARKQLFHPDDVKKKIQTSQLINRLQNFALLTAEDPDFAKKAMSGDQVRAAFGLLDKVVPSLKAVEHSGTGEGGAIVFKTVYESRA
jgi:hypothetical protein